MAHITLLGLAVMKMSISEATPSWAVDWFSWFKGTITFYANWTPAGISLFKNHTLLCKKKKNELMGILYFKKLNS